MGGSISRESGRHGRCATAASMVLAVMLAAGSSAAAVASPAIHAALNAINPVAMGRTAANNYRDGRFYATDLSEHPTIRAAFQRSIMPVDMSANVKAAFLGRIHPVKLAGALADPLMIELQREIASGQGIQPRKLVAALNPTVIATTFAGGFAGDLAGAAAQSALAGLGPVGAAAGLLLRPAISFGGSMFGYSVGLGMGQQHLSFKQAVAASLRQIEPGRDTGQLVGGTAGAILGQVLIPIPIVGAIIGGTIGGTAGAMIGQFLGNHGPTGKVSRWIKGMLGRLADKLDGGAKTPPDPTPAAPGGTGAGTSSPTDTPSPATGPGPVVVVPTPSPTPGPPPIIPPLDQTRVGVLPHFDAGPGMDDLPFTSR